MSWVDDIRGVGQPCPASAAAAVVTVNAAGHCGGDKTLVTQAAFSVQKILATPKKLPVADLPANLFRPNYFGWRLVPELVCDSRMKFTILPLINASQGTVCI